MRAVVTMTSLVLAAAGPAAAAFEVGVNERSLQVGEVTYAYQVYRPAALDDAAPAPLVVDIHGWSSNGAQQAALSGLRAVADAEGFLLTHPSAPGNAWDAGTCCRVEPRDEVVFFRALVAAIAAEASVDPRRVYATGLSNGGGMTHRLACDAADLFAAAAPLAFPVPNDPLPDCRPSRAIPLLMFMGLTDALVPYENGGFGDARESFAYWRQMNGCPDGDPQDVVTAPSGLSYCETYTGCAGDVETGLCSITARSFGGAFFDGHVLYLNDDWNLAEIVWDFLSRWMLPEDTSAPSGVVRGKTVLDLADGKQKAKTEWTVTLGGRTWSALAPDGSSLTGSWIATDTKGRRLALSLTDASRPALAAVIAAAGGPTLAPENVAAELGAVTNKKRTRVTVRCAVPLDGGDTFSLQLRGKLKRAP
jgi:polyhydroxybutyrate depolymerase